MKKAIMVLLILSMVLSSAVFAEEKPMEQIRKQDRVQTNINEEEQTRLRLEITERLRLLDEACDQQQLRTMDQTRVQFRDMENHWSREQVMNAACWGLVNGYPDGSFRPDRPISGPEGALMLSRMLRTMTGDPATINDSGQVNWDRIPEWAKDSFTDPVMMRIASQSEFYGESQLNRLQFAVMLARAIGLQDGQLSPEIVDFIDQDEIPAEFAMYIHTLRLMGVVEGFQGRFEATRTVNRAEASAMMIRVIKMLSRSDPEALIDNGNLSIVLRENPSTGYSWNYTISNKDVIQLIEDEFIQGAANGETVGAGGTHKWLFRGVLEGEARLEFRYYRSWEGEGSSIDEREYLIKVGQNRDIISFELLVQ